MTEVELSVADKGEVTLEISDINGRIMETFHETSLQRGIHRFRVGLSTAGTYMLTARQRGRASSIKMVCNGGSSNNIEYVGLSTEPASMLKSFTTKPFDLGGGMPCPDAASATNLQTSACGQTPNHLTLPIFFSHFFNNHTTAKVYFIHLPFYYL